MPIDFDLDEEAPDIDPDQVDLDAVFERQPTTSNLGMSEIESRLKKAQYYQLILGDSLFSDPDEPEIASEVDDEIRGFIRERMGALVGIGHTVKTEHQFSEEEADLLRELADPSTLRVLKMLVSKVQDQLGVQSAPKPQAKKNPQSLKKVKKDLPASSTEKAKPAQAAPSVPNPVTKPGGYGKKKKMTKTVTHPDTGDEIKIDVTAQTRPMGSVQPFPTATNKSQIEAQMAVLSHQSAQMGAQVLEANLKGR